MEFSFLPDSIVNEVSNAKDYDSPYSFLSFIQYSNSLKNETNEQLKEYQTYINSWAKHKNLQKNEERQLVRDAYINLLREITLNFSTEEEKRFILNADFNDDSDLDIVIPFFIQKLKEISFYYNRKRKEIKNSIIKYNLKGSDFGVESIIKKIIYEHIEENYKTTSNQISSFYKNFDISLNELYSDTSDFYDKKEDSDFVFSNKIDPEIFINIKQSIIDAVSAYPFYLENSEKSIINSFTYNPILSGTELNYLKNRDFINYFNNGEDSLKLNLFKNLYSKFTGTDFYYLSTNSENKTLSGLLFKSENSNAQFLNKHFPTTILNHSLDDLYSIYDIGGFFIPQNQGILIYNTPDKSYSINSKELSPDKLYVFPDPNKIGNTIYTSEQENKNVPLIYNINVEWNRVKASNGFRINDVLSNNYNQLFYGYQSKQQDIKISSEGISKVTDNITFWSGDKDQIWKGSFDLNKYPIDNDLESLLTREGVVADWYSDEYNNEFSLYKKVNSYSKSISSKILNDDGIILGSNTEFESRDINDVSLYEKKNINKGKVFVRNNFHNKISNITDCLSGIFLKYPTYVVDEVKDSVIKFFLIDNIFVIETENYVISDTYSYDIYDNFFKTSNTAAFYIRKKDKDSNFLDSFVNPWYDEKYKKIFLVFIKTLENSLSASNYKYITPVIYSTNTKKVNYQKIYPLNTTYTNIYSLSTQYGDIPEINLVEYCGGSFTKNSFLNEFNFTYMGKNLNSIPFIVNEKLKYINEEETFVSESPLMLKPFYYYLDNNYSNPELQYFVKGISNKSGYLGLKDKDSLNLVEHEANKINYAFASNVDVFQINEAGKYVVHFDWETYNDVNVFIGCSSLNVKQIEENILIYYNSKLTYLTGYNEEKSIFKFKIENNEFDVKVNRPTYPSNDVLLFNVESTSNESFSGTFCGDSIYRKLKIVKNGGGIGEVVTDPPCIYCGDDCEYLYPLNSNIVLVASASRISEFAGWYGDSDCYGQKNDCVVNMNDNKTIIATFDPLPLYRVIVLNNMGRVVSLDGEIDVGVGEQTTYYYLKSYVTLSAAPPLSGYKFRRFSGVPCYAGERMCTFIVYGDTYIESLYSKIIYYDLNVVVKSEVDVYPSLLVNTIAGERALLTNDNRTILINPEPRGIVNWEIYNEPIISTYSSEYRSLSENTFISLTAEPYSERYFFKKWISGPCENSSNIVCKFSLNDHEKVTAYFELIRYTVTIVISGFGEHRIFSIPSGINCDSSLISPICEYNFVSGTNVTIYSEDLPNSTLLSITSNDVPSSEFYMVSSGEILSINFNVNKNITLTAVYVPFDKFLFELYKFGPNRVIFSTNPYSTRLYSDLTTTSAEDVFAMGTNVGLIANYAGNSKILYYKTSTPITNRYVAGNGIQLGASYVDITTGDTNGFIFINNSLILNDGLLGAPYAESEVGGNANGVSISYTSFENVMLNNIAVSAFISGGLPPVVNVSQTPTATQTPTPTPTRTPNVTPTQTPTPTPTPTNNKLGVVSFANQQINTLNSDPIFPF